MGARGAAVVGFVGSQGNTGSHAGGEYGASTVLRCRRSRDVGGDLPRRNPGGRGGGGGEWGSERYWWQGQRPCSAPRSQGNWRSRVAMASAAVSGRRATGVTAAFGGGAVAARTRARRLRAQARPPRAPIRRSWAGV